MKGLYRRYRCKLTSHKERKKRDTEEEKEFDLKEYLGSFQRQMTALMNANMDKYTDSAI